MVANPVNAYINKNMQEKLERLMDCLLSAARCPKKHLTTALDIMITENLAWSDLEHLPVADVLQD